MRKAIRLLAFLAALALFLGGCARQAAPRDGDPALLLPEPPTFDAEALTGSEAADDAALTLYYPASDGLSLSEVARTVRLQPGESVVTRALGELGSGDPAGFAAATDPQIFAGVNAESACGVAVVDLPLDAIVNLSDADFYTLCVSIADTLNASNAADAVNVLVGGEAAQVAGLPLGAFTEVNLDPAANFAQLTAESERLTADPASACTRSAILYYPSADGLYLLPEVRSFDVRAEDPVQSVLDALARLPQRSCCICAIPANLDSLAVAPEIVVTPAGEQILELRFTSALANYLAFAGIDTWQLYGSIVLSVCSFVPELSGVRIYMEDAPVRTCAMPGRAATFADGILRRADFAERIGSSAVFALPDASGCLTRRETPVSRAADGSPAEILAAMIESADAGSIFPDGIRASDILGAFVQDRIATVNLSASFYAKCQSLNAAQERRLIYAMINSVCALPRVGAVRFVVEGRQIDSLGSAISLKTALLPDPGCFAEATD